LIYTLTLSLGQTPYSQQVFGSERRLAAFQAYSEQLGNTQNFESQWPTPNADDYFQVELEQLVQTLQKLSRIMAGQDLKEDDKAFFSNELAASQSRINCALVDLGKPYHSV